MDTVWYRSILCTVLFSWVATFFNGCSGKDISMSKVPEAVFLEPELRQAAEMVLAGRSTAAVNLVQKSEVEINTVGPEGDTLLLLAIANNDLKTVKALLLAKADPNLPSSTAPLAIAVEKASIDVVQILLEAGANPNGTANSEPAIWRAALFNRMEAVKLLKTSGAKLDNSNIVGESPAIAAVQAYHYLMALLLLDLGASPFACSDEGYTLGFWVYHSEVSPKNKEGKARLMMIERLKAVGYSWPPLPPKEILLAKKRNEWPPVHN